MDRRSETKDASPTQLNLSDSSTASSAVDFDNFRSDGIVNGSSTAASDAPITVDVTSDEIEDAPDDDSTVANLATSASWAVNWFLLGAKAFVVFQTNSLAVAAALVDSAVDLTSQFVLSTAEWYMGRYSESYPVGRSRLEALSLIAVGVIMIFAMIEVIQVSVQELIEGFIDDQITRITVQETFFIILGVGIVLKFVLWIFCSWASKVLRSETLLALAEDHFNDVLSNLAALVAASVAAKTPAWYVDPLGAVVISAVICWRWGDLLWQQSRKLVGFAAPPEYIQELEDLAREHHSSIKVDSTKAYYSGAKYVVEMDLVLPGDLPLMASYDITMALQHKLEALEDVERAYVHVDYQQRDTPKHKTERVLLKKFVPTRERGNSTGSQGTVLTDNQDATQLTRRML